MKTTLLHKKWFKILAIVLVLLVILLFAANSMISRKAGSVIREKLSADTTSYVIGFDKVRVNIFTQTVKIFDIHVKPSTTAMELLKSDALSPVRIEATVEKVTVNNVGIMQVLEGKSLDIGSLVINRPAITLYSPQGMFPDSKAEKPGEAEQAADSSRLPFHEAKIGGLGILHGTFSWVNVQEDKIELLASDLNFEMDHVHIHHPQGDSSSFVLDVDDISIMLASIEMSLPGKLYTLKTDKIGIGYRKGEISIDSLMLIPAYSKEKFGRVVGKQTDRFDVSIENLLVSGIAFDSIVKKKVIIEKVTLTRPVADIYRDKAIPRDMSHFPKLYQTSVANIPIPVDVALVEIKNAYINYQEKVEWATDAGGVIFDTFNIMITGILNDPEILKEGHSMKVDGTARLMGNADLTLHLDLPVGRRDEYFTLSGSTGSFTASMLNPLVTPLAAIEAKGGTVKRCNFYLLGKRDTAVARIDFLYKDMEMFFLKKEKESQGVFAENKFLSFLAQTAMHNDNPQEGKDVRIGLGSFDRDPNKGFFNYIWKTIQSGLINTMAPIKKNHAQDMDWETFSKNWEKVLQNDRATLNQGKGKKDSEKNK